MFAALGACADEDVDLDADLDGDGFTARVDCDDEDAAITPEADENCSNDIDDNCNGYVDSREYERGGGEDSG